VDFECEATSEIGMQFVTDKGQLDSASPWLAAGGGGSSTKSTEACRENDGKGDLVPGVDVGEVAVVVVGFIQVVSLVRLL